MHVHFHFDHDHDGLFGRVTRDLGSALDWLTGPGMSQQQRLERARSEAQNDKQGYGVL